jgi:hypothetical protein
MNSELKGKEKKITKEQEKCKCRGNSNANYPELPCSSCGGRNPNWKPDNKIDIAEEAWKQQKERMGKYYSEQESWELRFDEMINNKYKHGAWLDSALGELKSFIRAEIKKATKHECKEWHGYMNGKGNCVWCGKPIGVSSKKQSSPKAVTELDTRKCNNCFGIPIGFTMIKAKQEALDTYKQQLVGRIGKIRKDKLKYAMSNLDNKNIQVGVSISTEVLDTIIDLIQEEVGL